MKRCSRLLIGVLAAFAGLPPAVAQNAAIEVEIDGVSGELRTNVESVLSIARVGDRQGLLPSYIRRLHEEAIQEIGSALQPFGHYRPTVEATLEERSDGTWLAHYAIDVGDRVPVTALALQVSGEGHEEAAFLRAVERFPLAEGDELSHSLYEEGKRAFTAASSELGYFEGSFTQRELTVDLDRYEARIDLAFATGPRFSFGAVTFEQAFLAEGFLDHYVPFAAGDPFSLSLLRDLQDRLNSSGYFGLVEVLSQPEVAVDGQVPITVRLTEGKSWRLDSGLGYGTDTGPRGTVKLTWRRLNRRGHNAGMDLRVSELENGVGLVYTMPFQKALSLSKRERRLDLVTLGASHGEIETDTYETVKSIAGVRTTRHWGDWRQTLSLAVHRDDFTIGLDAGEVFSLVPSAEWSRVKSDHRLAPNRGFRLGLEVSGAHESALSDVSLLRAKVSGKWIRSFGDEGSWGRRHHLRVRGEVGAILSEDFRRLPPSFRFFTGGDQSVRGYDYDSLGDFDEQGNVIGGDRLVVGSLEYEYLIYEKWGAAVFFDAGSASRDLADRFNEGVGVGVSWRSPVGPVRIDFAWAVSQEGEPLRIHLTIGPAL